MEMQKILAGTMWSSMAAYLMAAGKQIDRWAGDKIQSFRTHSSVTYFLQLD
jgi:hypothetical protein